MPRLIPRVKYAFCGMSLENGTKAIAYLNIFTYSIMASIFIINVLLEPVHLPDQEAHDPADYYSEAWALGKNMRATFFLESSTIMQLVFSSFLLYGANMGQSKILFSWVLIQTGLVFHSQLTVVLNFVLVLSIQRGTSFVLSFILQEVLTIAFQFYCMLVVYYYHLQLENFDPESGSVTS